MRRVDEYRGALRGLPVRSWDGYLAEHSGLPGPRANLELVAAVAEEGQPDQLYRYAGSVDEYLALCGAVGLGRLAAQGDQAALGQLHRLASDERWRVREGVAMGLQRIGDADAALLRRIVGEWADDRRPLVQRAAVAGICEPRLLADPDSARQALDVVDRVTARLAALPADGRRDPDVRVLRQALGYCWSVAIVPAPADGFSRLARWAALDDTDTRWVVRENLKKARLQKADPERLAALRTTVGL